MGVFEIKDLCVKEGFVVERIWYKVKGLLEEG